MSTQHTFYCLSTQTTKIALSNKEDYLRLEKNMWM